MAEEPARVALDRGSPLPLWAQLVVELRRRIDAGEFAERFPSENELVASYRISRHTVREALRRLREAGLVVSHRGRSSEVGKPPLALPAGALYSLFRAVEAQGLQQRSEVRALQVTTDRAAARRLGLAGDSRLIYLERVRFAGDEPFALDRAWLPEGLARPLLAADFGHCALYDELASRCGVRPDSGREEVHAAVPSADERRALGLRATAVLRIERLTRMDRRPVEWRITVVRGDHYCLTVEWQMAAAPQMDAAVSRRR